MFEQPPLDPHRPRYHFAAPPGTWINDPVPFYDPLTERYHVFLQHNPNAPVWGDMHWLHVSSTDLLTWTNHGIALTPSRTPGDPDFGGVWTGCISRRPSDGKYIALYTAIPTYKPFTQLQCAAVSDDLITWEKVAENPLTGLSKKPEGYGSCFRDPQTFVGPDGKWYCVIGGEQRDGKGGSAFLYAATDDTLLHWKYQHVLFEGDTETGHDFECPDFFPVPGSDKWCLITSRNKSWWHIGTLDAQTMRFHRESWGACDTELFYAAKSCVSASGERLVFGWIREARPETEQVAAGWSGMLSLPRAVRLSPENTARFTNSTLALGSGPVTDRFLDVTVHGGTEQILPKEFQSVREIVVRFSAGSRARSRGIRLQGKSGESLAIPGLRGRGSSLYIHRDASLIEVFSSNGTTTTYRIHPEQPDPLTIAIFSDGADSKVDVLTWV